MKKILALVASLGLAACAGSYPGDHFARINLTGAQEVPPVSTSASGTGRITVNDNGSVSGSIATTGVRGTAAHIHQGAKSANGPVIVPLTKNGDVYSVPAGAKLNPAQTKAFMEGNLYVNVHSAENKGGEIRAQLAPDDFMLR